MDESTRAHRPSSEHGCWHSYSSQVLATTTSSEHVVDSCQVTKGRETSFTGHGHSSQRTVTCCIHSTVPKAHRSVKTPPLPTPPSLATMSRPVTFGACRALLPGSCYMSTARSAPTATTGIRGPVLLPSHTKIQWNGCQPRAPAARRRLMAVRSQRLGRCYTARRLSALGKGASLRTGPALNEHRNDICKLGTQVYRHLSSEWMMLCNPSKIRKWPLSPKPTSSYILRVKCLSAL